jgi:hypothetical protein
MGGILMSFKLTTIANQKSSWSEETTLINTDLSYKICDDNNLMERCPNKLQRVGLCVTASFAS